MTRKPKRKMRARGHLRLITSEDMFYAAEAVVDAAIQCNEARSDRSFPEDFKQLLIEELVSDPKFTFDLFGAEQRSEEESSELH